VTPNLPICKCTERIKSKSQSFWNTQKAHKRHTKGTQKALPPPSDCSLRHPRFDGVNFKPSGSCIYIYAHVWHCKEVVSSCGQLSIPNAHEMGLLDTAIVETKSPAASSVLDWHWVSALPSKRLHERILSAPHLYTSPRISVPLESTIYIWQARHSMCTRSEATKRGQES